MSQLMFANDDDDILTTVKEKKSVETASVASKERNNGWETENLDRNKSDLESIVDEENSVWETERRQNIDTARESENWIS